MTSRPRHLRIVPVATDPVRVAQARQLFAEYAAALGIDLGGRGFAEELAGLPGSYAPPRGALLLAYLDGELAGCVAVQPLDASACEMKRLYLRDQARGAGLGRELARAAIAVATAMGYAAMRLDTLPTMGPAQALYRSLGFRPIEAYRGDPLPGAQFFELALLPSSL